MKPASEITVFNMVATPFTDTGEIDLDAFAALVEQMCAANVAIYVGSGGAGEGHALNASEFERLYRAAIEVAAGRITVAANPPEQRTARQALTLATLAADSGVDLVQLYGPDGGHGMVPTHAELERFWRFSLDRLDCPIALSVHAAYGYRVSPILIAELCRTYSQITAVNVIVPMDYFLELKAQLSGVGREIRLYTSRLALIQGLYAGCSGWQVAEPNLIPHTMRSLADAVATGDRAIASELYEFIGHFSRIVNRWAPSTARWVKMGLNVLGRPGGNGVIREPYLLPGANALDEMRRAFDDLRVEEVEARCARHMRVNP